MPPTIPPVPPPHDHPSPRGSRRGGVHGAHGCSGGGEADLCQTGPVVVAAASPATVAAGSAVRVGRRGWLESGARPAPPTAAVTKADPPPPHGLAQAPPARAWVGVPAALWAFPHVPIQGLWVMWVRVAEKTAGGCSGEEGRPGRECRPPCEQRGQTRRCCPVRRPLRRVSAAPPPRRHHRRGATACVGPVAARWPEPLAPRANGRRPPLRAVPPRPPGPSPAPGTLPRPAGPRGPREAADDPCWAPPTTGTTAMVTSVRTGDADDVGGSGGGGGHRGGGGGAGHLGRPSGMTMPCHALTNHQ